MKKFTMIFGLGLLALALTLVSVVPTYATDPTVTPAPAVTLSADEIAGLSYMREEEKLAHDVYVALYEKWGLPVFDNISKAETQHTEAVKVLMDRYGVEDPTVGNDPGVFSDAELQSLYDQLLAQGMTSLGDALKVGATIEEVDILDLQERIAQTEQEDIKWVYGNLERGSENHLRAFTQNLTRNGETYAPQYLTQEAYDAIVNADGPGRGRGPRWSR